MQRRFGILALLLAVASASPSLAQQAQLTYFAPSTFDPIKSSMGHAIGDNAMIVGEAQFIDDIPREAFNAWGTILTKLDRVDPFAQPTEGSARALAGETLAGQLVKDGAPRAVRWRSPPFFDPEILDPIVGGDVVPSDAYGVSADENVVVGWTKKWGGVTRAFSWTKTGGMIDLGSIGAGTGSSEAFAASFDGSIVVGKSSATVGGTNEAFRWTPSGMVGLGTIGGAAGDSCARAITPDGTTIVGDSVSPSGFSRAFVHTAAGGMVELPTIDGYAGNSCAYSISDDGRTIAGTCESELFPDGEGCIWIDGVAHSLRDYVSDIYKIDMYGKSFLTCRCSPNGRLFTGQGYDKTQPMAFRLQLRPEIDYVTIGGDVEEGEAVYVKAGATFVANVVATDPDGGTVRFTGRSHPTGMTFTPTNPASGPSPLTVEARWEVPATDAGRVTEVSMTFADDFPGYVTRKFKIVVLPNVPPTAEPIEPLTVECVEGVHNVVLSTVVADEEGSPLTVTWRVDGQTRETDSDVASGSVVDFDYPYSHGTHDVEVRVSDGDDTISLGTTVTVQDSTAPILIVAQDVVVPTDPGVDFATNVVLPEPEASDAAGHAVTLTNDAPETYPAGRTLVTWTAVDEAGNKTTATQKVIVEDREAPIVEGALSVELFVDPGKTFSTAALPFPTATDNVDDPSQIRFESDAPAELPIGTTTVTFRAIDRAGNSADWRMEILVVNRAPQANAGADVVATTTSEKGLRVSLDGSASSDPDEQRLKFAWSAPGVRLAGAKKATPSGLFPVGRTFATVTVTDPAGASATDRIRIVVKLKNGKRRPSGAAANASFDRALAQAKQAATGGRSGASSLAGLACASAAAAYGDAAGEFVRWEEGQSEADALLAYAELRMLQKAYGEAAASELLSAYAETGDQNVLAAAACAASGSACAQADLSE